jgi:hypothetical protein
MQKVAWISRVLSNTTSGCWKGSTKMKNELARSIVPIRVAQKIKSVACLSADLSSLLVSQSADLVFADFPF